MLDNNFDYVAHHLKKCESVISLNLSPIYTLIAADILFPIM